MKTTSILLCALWLIVLFSGCAAPVSEIGIENPEYLDVFPNAWYAESVDYVARHGIMVGTGDGCFRPNAVLDRGTFATILHRFAGTPEPEGKCPFVDVEKDSPHREAITWAAEQGITFGTGAESFSPDRTLTREELACMVIRHLEATDEVFLYSPEVELAIWDLENSSAFAYNAMSKMRDIGLYEGDQNNYAHPHVGATRADAAVVLYRVAQGLDIFSGPATIEVIQADGDSDVYTMSSQDTIRLMYILHTNWSETAYVEMEPTHILNLWGKQYMLHIEDEMAQGNIVNYEVSGERGTWTDPYDGDTIVKILEFIEQYTAGVQE